MAVRELEYLSSGVDTKIKSYHLDLHLPGHCDSALHVLRHIRTHICHQKRCHFICIFVGNWNLDLDSKLEKKEIDKQGLWAELMPGAVSGGPPPVLYLCVLFFLSLHTFILIEIVPILNLLAQKILLFLYFISQSPIGRKPLVNFSPNLYLGPGALETVDFILRR